MHRRVLSAMIADDARAASFAAMHRAEEVPSLHTAREVPERPLPWVRLLIWFMASRALIVVVAAVSLRFAPHGPFFETPKSPLHWFIRWDAGWFRDVIENGYIFHPDRVSNVNFLPAYPLLVRCLAWAMPVELAGYLVTQAMAFAAAVLLWRVTERVSRAHAAPDGAVLFYLFGPVSVFFVTLYSEATFLAFALAAVLAAHRGRWLLAGCAGAAAALSRSVGVLLVLPLIVMFVQQQRDLSAWRAGRTWWSALCCGLPAGGAALFTLYLGWRFHEPKAYLISHQHAGHVSSFVWKLFDSHHFATLPPFYQLWFGSAVFVGLGLLLGGALLRQPIAFTLFSLAMCLLYFSVKSLEGMPRFLSIVFPFYATLGFVWARWRLIGWTFLIASGLLSALSVLLFVNGYWFT